MAAGRKRFIRRKGLPASSAVMLLAAGCGAPTPPSTAGTTKPEQADAFAVQAVRDQLATNTKSTVAHETGTGAPVDHHGAAWVAMSTLTLIRRSTPSKGRRA